MDLERYVNLLSQGEIEEAERIRIDSGPDKLYKYVSFEDSELDDKKLYSLENEAMWFSEVEELNDPYEYRGMILDRVMLHAAGLDDKAIDVYEKIFDPDGVIVSCLTGSGYNNLPMWAYYGNKSKGFCVEYDVIKKDAIHEVLYEPTRIRVGKLVLECANNYIKTIQGDEHLRPIVEGQMRLLMQSMFIKDESWKHENEYRIVFPLSRSGNVLLKTIVLRTNRIIAGINCEESKKKELNRISKKIRCGNLYCGIPSKENYGIELVRY